MLRAFVLSFMMLTAIAATLPLGESHARWQQGSRASARQRYGKNYQRNRRAWLRRRNARLRQRRAIAAQRRRQAQQAALNNPSNQMANNFVKVSAVSDSPLGIALPQGWSNAVRNGNETRWSVRGADGQDAAAVVLSTVAQPSSNASAMNGRRRTLGGVATSELRRRVIDRMVVEGGYVTNDVERTIGGRRAFVVMAQSTKTATPTKNAAVFNAQSASQSASPRAVTYYFVEVDGGIYSIATDAAPEHSQRIVAQVESVVASLRANNPAPPQTYAAKRSQ